MTSCASWPRYEPDLARRQYDAVDPDYRLIAAELERRWNDRLVEAHRLEEQLATASLGREAAPAPAADERDRLMALGADLGAAWHHPRTAAETRKRILRTAVAENVAKVAGSAIELVTDGQGVDHTRLSVPRNRPGKHRWSCRARQGGGHREHRGRGSAIGGGADGVGGGRRET